MIKLTIFFCALFSMTPLVFHASSSSYDSCRTEIYQAAYKGKLHTIESLIQQGVSVNTQNPCSDKRWSFAQETPLFAAVGEERLEIVRFLLDHGARVDIHATNSGTVLHKAARSGNPKLIRLLLQAGADININHNEAGFSGTGLALHMTTSQALYYEDRGYQTSFRDQFDVIRLLTEAGSDLNARRSEDGKTVLHMAVSKKSLKIARYFLEQGASPNIKDKQEGKTPLMSAVIHHKNNEMISLLIDHGADVHATDPRGNTALAWAVRYNNRDAVKLLIQQGANDRHPSVLKMKKKVRQETHEENTENFINLMKYAGIPLLYSGLCIALYEGVYINNPQNNWMAGFNAYTLTVTATIGLGAMIGTALWPADSGFLGKLAKFNGTLVGGLIGIPVGILLAVSLDLPRHFQEHRGLYYLAPVISVSIPIIAWSMEL